jgi:beta-glucanase (GH16 family)
MAQKASSLHSSAALASTLAFAALVGCENPSTAPDDLTPVEPTSSFAPSAKPPSKRPSKPPPEQDSFTDFLDAYDTSRWMKADGWTNGPPFDNAWSAENVVFRGGEMVLRLDDVTRLGEPYSSGAYQTLGFHGYGCYEASFMPVPESGVVTSFFTFAGPFDDGGNAQHNEIDVEFVGRYVAGEGTEIQFNFFRNDDSYTSRNEHMHTLPFDPTAGFSRYGFKWMSTGIEWYVNGEKVHAVRDTPENPTPKATESLQKIMMNLWPVDGTAAAWAGEFVYPGQALEARYQWVRYIRGEDCDLSQGLNEPEPPQPPDDASGLAVSDIALTLVSRGTQVIARVSVMDATGAPASTATVTGEWTGVITKGDVSRDTDAEGIATFYSARTRESGDVMFCVTGITRNGSTYDPADNVETCVSIWK